MSRGFTIVGDTIYLDGEAVAVILPKAAQDNSLRGRIETALRTGGQADVD
jgi:hypothetical protein